jgi:hypothetical protein
MCAQVSARLSDVCSLIADDLLKSNNEEIR